MVAHPGEPEHFETERLRLVRLDSSRATGGESVWRARPLKSGCSGPSESWLHDHLIAVIDPSNAASITLAARLGFCLDRHDTTPRGQDVAVYRLDLRPD